MPETPGTPVMSGVKPKAAGGTAVADFVIRTGAVFAAELEACWPRSQETLSRIWRVADRGLEAGDCCRIAQRRVAGEGEGREGRGADAGQADRGGEILARAGPVSMNLRGVRETDIVRKVRAEDVGLGHQDALDADVGHVLRSGPRRGSRTCRCCRCCCR